MKFTVGSETDIALSIALKHEFLRCEEAFEEFERSAAVMIMIAEARKQAGFPADANQSRFVAFKTYNAYGRFVHHLYEFLLGAMARERCDTKKIRAEDADFWMQANAQRVLTGRRQSILNGTAPSWENQISAFPEVVPTEFAQEFRGVRNQVNAHVTHKRANKSLTDFYHKYHMFVHMTYWNCLGFWGAHRHSDFPDLQEITGFSILITKKNVQSAAPAHITEEERQRRSNAIMDNIWRLSG